MKRVLDPCCGSKMFWFCKDNPDVEFCDIREMDNEAIWKSGESGKHMTTHWIAFMKDEETKEEEK